MTQLDLVLMPPSAIEARRSGHREGRRLGDTLRGKYLELLKAHPEGLTDQEAGVLLGCLSTTVGARRLELMTADASCIVSAGRVTSPLWRTSRTKWRAR